MLSSPPSIIEKPISSTIRQYLPRWLNLHRLLNRFTSNPHILRPNGQNLNNYTFPLNDPFDIIVDEGIYSANTSGEQFPLQTIDYVDLRAPDGAYVNNYGDDDEENRRLVLPTWHKEFMERYNYNIKNRDENLLKCIFTRDWDSVKRTKEYWGKLQND